jgi:glycosyltransferase involved in cell wall biosynthesis
VTTTENLVCAVVSATNEAQTIENVLHQLHRARVHTCVLVVNGSRDQTLQMAERCASRLKLPLHVQVFPDALGPDVAKATGTLEALRIHGDVDQLVYVDGDWKGSFGPMLRDFLDEAAETGCDCMWTRHTGPPRQDIQLWQNVLQQVAPHLASAAPAQSPLFIRRSLLQYLSPTYLHHPGLWMAEAASLRQPTVQLSTSALWDVRFAGNPVRSALHQSLMADTLIGDALDGCRILLNRRPSREWRGKRYDGFHPRRRMDVLQEVAAVVRHYRAT